VFPAITIGGAMGHAGDNTDIVRQNADFALYHAKEEARGHYVEYSAGLGTAITDRFRAIRDVGIALAEDRIDAYYQPIVRLDTSQIVGFEALCRMTTRSGDIIPAASFHEATKDAQVAAHLTQRMLTRVAADARRWLDAGISFQHVGINLSAADFHGGNLADRICSIFENAGVPLKHVILEVTESVYIGQRDHVVADEIKVLRSKGLRVALDDFGTGFASLTHLLTVPVDIIKIDKSFVDRLVPGDAGSIIVEGVLGIARKLGIRVVAEGIETPLQAHLLLEMGAKLGQGYHFSKAVDRNTATSLLIEFGENGSASSGLEEKLGRQSTPTQRAS
jgi:EAL domain-containing protein (putative c-di-GMP-specific phosphodiesterase class I)